MEYEGKEVTMQAIELIPPVMAFLTSATSLAAALVQLQTAKTTAQATKKRANRKRRQRANRRRQRR